MPASHRLPITCTVTGDSYVAPIQIGAGAVSANLIVDTGSSATAVNAGFYDPTQDSSAVTGNLAQNLSYLSGSLLGAVVQTSLVMAPAASFTGANVAVNYAAGASCFGAAHGILGLAYKPGNPAFTMPGNSWQNKYTAPQFPAAFDPIDPFLDQMTAAGALDCVFAIAVKRSLADQATAVVNSGILVLGGGADCTDLYQGAFSYATVIAANQYNTSLISVQVGSQPPIPVAAPPSWSNAASNSIVDSGTATLTLSQPLYNAVQASFNAINPAFGQAIANASCDQTILDLAAWPALTFTLQGGATIVISPENYWQFDAGSLGKASAMIVGDNGALGGMSILGLPLFAGNFVLFDRTAGEPGRIGFARLS